MKRANVNYWVDSTMGVAFVVCAVSGILFLLPSGWWTSVAMLGLSAATWHTLHDWSGVLMTAAVAGHLVLHWRWAWKMTRRTFADQASAASAAGPALERSSGAARPQVARERQRVYDRKDFLGAALAAGAVAFAGLGLLTRDPSTAAASSTQTAAAGEAGSWGEGYGGGQGYGGDTSGYGSDGTGAASSRVTVDASRCTGCGHCLSVCPDGVFAWGGGAVTAASPDACRLCGRCLQVCRPRAITLSA